METKTITILNTLLGRFIEPEGAGVIHFDKENISVAEFLEGAFSEGCSIIKELSIMATGDIQDGHYFYVYIEHNNTITSVIRYLGTPDVWIERDCCNEDYSEEHFTIFLYLLN